MFNTLYPLIHSDYHNFTTVIHLFFDVDSNHIYQSDISYEKQEIKKQEIKKQEIKRHEKMKYDIKDEIIIGSIPSMLYER